MSKVRIKEFLRPFLNRLPAVSKPEGHVHFKTKLVWTVVILLLYFVLTNVPLFGLHPDSRDLFAMYRTIMAGEFGSIVQLGIGPIVTASIILQLLIGSDIIKLDLSDPSDQSIFQGVQKLLVVVMIVMTAVPQLLGGFLLPDYELAGTLGVSVSAIIWILLIQLAIGGILILFMDEVVSKWGIGSGVGLFIVASISQAMFGGVFSWEGDPFVVHPATGEALAVGLIPRWYEIFTTIDMGWLLTGEGLFFLMLWGGGLALIGTIAIFLVVVYVESMRVEIPLAHSSVRGARGKFPVKLIYASVLPIILVMALVANIQMGGMLLWESDVPILGNNPMIGEFVDGIAVSGLMFYLAPIAGPHELIPGVHGPGEILLRVMIFLLIMIFGSIVFALFWIETTNMGPKNVAKQIQRSGMQIPGYRRDIGVVERIMKRYIPKVTIIGGAFIGALAALASFTGIIGHAGGTGLLLTVSIIYKMYEQVAKEQMSEMHPMVRTLLGGD